MALELQAQTLYNVLEAIFDYADANFAPRGIGLLTMEKKKIMIQNAGMHAELAGLHTSELVPPLPSSDFNLFASRTTAFASIPIPVVTAQYQTMECPMHILPPYVPEDSPYQFREADQPALTKAGWIKSETIGLLTGSETQDDVRTRYHQIPLPSSSQH